MTIKSCIDKVNHSLGTTPITITNSTIKNIANEVSRKVGHNKDNIKEEKQEDIKVCCE
jgi:hypothetical protein